MNLIYLVYFLISRHFILRHQERFAVKILVFIALLVFLSPRFSNNFDIILSTSSHSISIWRWKDTAWDKIYFRNMHVAYVEKRERDTQREKEITNGKRKEGWKVSLGATRVGTRGEWFNQAGCIRLSVRSYVRRYVVSPCRTRFASR